MGKIGLADVGDEKEVKRGRSKPNVWLNKKALTLN